MGYVGWLVNSMRNETTTVAAISQNKAAFRDYVMSFEEGREVVPIKKAEMEGNKKTSATGTTRTKGAPLPKVPPPPASFSYIQSLYQI